MKCGNVACFCWPEHGCEGRIQLEASRGSALELEEEEQIWKAVNQSLFRYLVNTLSYRSQKREVLVGFAYGSFCVCVYIPV